MNPKDPDPCPTCYPLRSRAKKERPQLAEPPVLGAGLLRRVDPYAVRSPVGVGSNGERADIRGKPYPRAPRHFLICPTCEGTGALDTPEKLSRAALELLEEG